MRASLRGSLERHGFVVAAEAADAASTVELALAERPEVCLLHVRMPGGGVATAHHITTRLPDTRVVMITADGGDNDLIDALRAGAVGYLSADTDLARLPNALRGVLAGEAAMPRKLVCRLIEEIRSHAGHRHLHCPQGRRVDLTAREWEVIVLVHQGLSTAEAARELLVSPVTVRRHVSAVVRKLGVPDRQAAVRLLDARL
jgi:DNA-binding NarL/FixJ family response regulator